MGVGAVWGCFNVFDKGSHFLVSHFLEWRVGLMGVGVVGGGADGGRGCVGDFLVSRFLGWGLAGGREVGFAGVKLGGGWWGSGCLG